jgi:hypothetical protein
MIIPPWLQITLLGLAGFWLICFIATFLIAKSRGYRVSIFLWGGLLAAPFALHAVWNAKHYDLEVVDEQEPDHPVVKHDPETDEQENDPVVKHDPETDEQENDPVIKHELETGEQENDPVVKHDPETDEQEPDHPVVKHDPETDEQENSKSLEGTTRLDEGDFREQSIKDTHPFQMSSDAHERPETQKDEVANEVSTLDTDTPPVIDKSTLAPWTTRSGEISSARSITEIASSSSTREFHRKKKEELSSKETFKRRLRDKLKFMSKKIQLPGGSKKGTDLSSLEHISHGICANCNQESYADWYGLCNACGKPFQK